jgi:hypothetical protein
VAYGGFGGSLFLIAVGAILRYAITWESDTIDIDVVGLILMLAGAATLLVTVFFALSGPGRPPRG